MSAENTADNKEKRRRRRRASVKEEEETELETEAEDDEDDEDSSAGAITVGKGRATPGRRNTQEVVKTSNAVTRFFGGIVEYFQGVRSEIDKVSWPTREETRRLTLIVVLATIIASILLGLVSLGFTEMFRIGLGSPVVFVVFFIIAAGVGFVLYRRSEQNNNASPY